MYPNLRSEQKTETSRTVTIEAGLGLASMKTIYFTFFEHIFTRLDYHLKMAL